MSIDKHSSWVSPLEQLPGSDHFVRMLGKIEPALMSHEYKSLRPEERQRALLREVASHAVSNTQGTPLIDLMRDDIAAVLHYYNSPFAYLFDRFIPDVIHATPALREIIGVVSTTFAQIGAPSEVNGNRRTWTLNGIGDLPRTQTLTMVHGDDGVSVSLITPTRTGTTISSLSLQRSTGGFIPSFTSQLIN